MLIMVNIENVRINALSYVSDTCLTRNGIWKWSSMQEDKKHIQENTVTYLVEVNNGYKKEVTFKFLSITDKITNLNDIRKTYKEVVMEDVDGEFGKVVCTTNDIKNATNSLKNKMTIEYKKTLKLVEKTTKKLNQTNKQLTNDLEHEKTMRKRDAKENAQRQVKLTEQLMESKNEVMVLTNELTATKRAFNMFKTLRKGGKKLDRRGSRKFAETFSNMKDRGATVEELTDFVHDIFGE